jgi:hypothetical protein
MIKHILLGLVFLCAGVAAIAQKDKNIVVSEAQTDEGGYYSADSPQSYDHALRGTSYEFVYSLKN